MDGFGDGGSAFFKKNSLNLKYSTAGRVFALQRDNLC